jgi:hypothetical protein
VETKTEQRFPAEQMRKRKFSFPTNTEFPFYGCFVWPIYQPQYVALSCWTVKATHPYFLVTVTGVGKKFFYLLDLLEFFYMIQVVSSFW